MSGLLFLAPALALALVMLARRYPGERRIVALGARCRRSAPRRPAVMRVLSAPSGRAPWALVPRGSALLACALATRPPPAALRS